MELQLSWGCPNSTRRVSFMQLRVACYGVWDVVNEDYAPEILDYLVKIDGNDCINVVTSYWIEKPSVWERHVRAHEPAFGFGYWWISCLDTAV